MDAQLTDRSHRPTTIIPPPRVTQHNHDARQLCTVPPIRDASFCSSVCRPLANFVAFAVDLQVSGVLGFISYATFLGNTYSLIVPQNLFMLIFLSLFLI